ncbi:MAG: cell division protein FtsZ [Treponema sp.]|jgi:cell division protein FtsZ|nr:cell division protein FtsZ [Treponema sp.]
MNIVVHDEACDSAPVVEVPAKIMVIGVGGCGTNVVNQMIASGLDGVDFITINTDIQDLFQKSKARTKVQIGKKLTGGRGAGGNPEKGEKAANEDFETLREHVKYADMVVITAGMGGGTGTGAAPVIAKAAREEGALTVAVVTKPFGFEGPYKMTLADEGIRKLRESVDTLIVISNQRLLEKAGQKTSLIEAYKMADDVLCQGVRGISDLLIRPGFQNVDFADMEATMKDQGDALMGIGVASGENRSLSAAQQAIENPLLDEIAINGATHILVSVAANKSLTLLEVSEVVGAVSVNADPNVLIISGVILDEELEDDLRVMVIATGFKGTRPVQNPAGESVKPKEKDFIGINEWQRMKDGGAVKPADFLLRRGGIYSDDDLDVPAVMRNRAKNPPSDSGLSSAEGQ